jgi:hypothetical protein
MDKSAFVKIIKECIQEVLSEGDFKLKPLETPKVRKSWGDLNPTTRIHGQGKQGIKPKYDRNRDKNWKKDMDENTDETVNEMSTTSAAQGFYGKNWGDPDPERKKMKSIAAKSVGGILAENAGQTINLDGETFNRAWYTVLKKGQHDDNGNVTFNGWQIVGYSKNGLEEFGQLTYNGKPVISTNLQSDTPPRT